MYWPPYTVLSDPKVFIWTIKCVTNAKYGLVTCDTVMCQEIEGVLWSGIYGIIGPIAEHVNPGLSSSYQW